MRKVTLIGRVVLAGTTILTLAATSSTAEARARGFGLRFGLGTAAARTPAPVPARMPERSAGAGVPILLPVALPQTASAATRQPEVRVSQTGGGAARPVAGAIAPEKAKPALPPVRVAGPWCAPDRIVGAGVGFCEVN